MLRAVCERDGITLALDFWREQSERRLTFFGVSWRLDFRAGLAKLDAELRILPATEGAGL